MSQTAASAVVAVLAFAAGLLSWLDRGLGPVMARVGGEQVVTAFVDPTAQSKDDGKLVDSVRLSLGAAAQGAEIRMVGPQEFLSELGGDYPELARELKDLGPDAEPLIPRYVAVAGVLPADTASKLGALPGIEASETSGGRYQAVFEAFGALRGLSRWLGLGLVAALAATLTLLARLNAHFHRDSVATLRLWGAGPWAAQVPSVLGGWLVGAAGGLMAAVAWAWFAPGLAGRVRGLSPELLRDLPAIHPATGAAWIWLAASAAGLLAGVVGASLSSARRAREGY